MHIHTCAGLSVLSTWNVCFVVIVCRDVVCVAYCNVHVYGYMSVCANMHTCMHTI